MAQQLKATVRKPPDDTTVVVQRAPLIYAPWSTAAVNKERLPATEKLGDMELAYRQQYFDDDELRGAGGSYLIQNGAPDGIGLWVTSADMLCDFVNYEGTITGFESWPDIGTDSASLCGTGASTSLARREVTPPGGEWVIDACGTPGEANRGPTALTLISFDAQSTDQFPRLKVLLAGSLGVVLWSICWVALSRQSIPK